MIREATTRRNIAYSVVGYDQKEGYEEVRKLIEEKKQQYPLPQQIVVYCRTRDGAERLADVLGCRFYHAKMSPGDKVEVMEQLKSGTAQVFTSTNALGLGIDVASIRIVVHVGAREGMRQFVQESGRAGRNGDGSESITMRAYRTDRDGRVQWDRIRGIEEAMEEFLQGEQCRRVTLDREMDGRVDRVSCEEGEEVCDVCRHIRRKRRREDEEGEEGEESEVGRACEGGEENVEGFVRAEAGLQAKRRRVAAAEQRQSRVREIRAGEEAAVAQQEGLEALQFEEEMRQHRTIRSRQVEQQVQAAQRAEGLEGLFRKWQEQCVLCTNRQDHVDWRVCRQCTEEERGRMQQMWDALQSVPFERFSGCTFCRAPQGICYLWESVSHSGPARFKRRARGQCQFEGVLCNVVAGALAFRTDIQDWLCQEAGGNSEAGSDWGEGLGHLCQQWLGKRSVVGGVEMSGMCRLLQQWG